MLDIWPLSWSLSLPSLTVLIGGRQWQKPTSLGNSVSLILSHTTVPNQLEIEKIFTCLFPSDREKYLCLLLRMPSDAESECSDISLHTQSYKPFSPWLACQCLDWGVNAIWISIRRMLCPGHCVLSSVPCVNRSCLSVWRGLEDPLLALSICCFTSPQSAKEVK